jgi:peptide/nickel transport system permease protein
MGTDRYGRDILSRALWAGQISQSVGLLSMGISVLVGIMVGALAGFYGGWVDHSLSRLTETIITFPTYFIMIAIVALYGTSFLNLILVIGLTSWPITARVVRAEFLSLRERPFVESALATGAGKVRVIVRHILPNVVPVIVVAATLRVAYVILAEAGLSYLGFGIQPPTPSWGNMVAEGRTFLRTAWWITFFPGLFIFVSVMAYNLIGDGLRDAFDPRMLVDVGKAAKAPLDRAGT